MELVMAKQREGGEFHGSGLHIRMDGPDKPGHDGQR
jgi:hypothetical protein